MAYTIAFDVPESEGGITSSFYAATASAITFELDYAARFEDEGDAERFLGTFGESLRPWGVVVEVGP